MSDIDDYRKTTVTTMGRVTGDNFGEIRDFVRETAFVPEGGDESAWTPVPWGYADASRFGHDGDDYRSDGAPPCPPDGGYEGSGGYRAGSPDGAVFDYLHGLWIPLWNGDFVATGPKGEHYPVEAKMHAQTYEKVPASEATR